MRNKTVFARPALYQPSRSSVKTIIGQNHHEHAYCSGTTQRVWCRHEPAHSQKRVCSNCAGLWDATTFATHHWAEACRRGVDNAKTVVCVSDGAAWIWAMVFMCFAVRTEILDWWHAVQRIWTVANLHFVSGPDAAQWVSTQKAAFADSQLRQVMHAIRILYPRGNTLPEPVRQTVGYIFHNRRRMDYAAYRQAGYPIGSGAIESACKTVVQARMKQSGMRWSRNGAQGMLALRCLLLSQRWNALGTVAPPP